MTNWASGTKYIFFHFTLLENKGYKMFIGWHFHVIYSHATFIHSAERSWHRPSWGWNWRFQPQIAPVQKIYNLDVHINALASINQIINKFIRISIFSPTLSLAILKNTDSSAEPISQSTAPTFRVCGCPRLGQGGAGRLEERAARGLTRDYALVLV